MLRLVLLPGLIGAPALAQKQDDILRAQTEPVALGCRLTLDGQSSPGPDGGGDKGLSA